MEALHWPRAVLTKAVHFKNLTGASTHVGLSQPQLSRLISQLEKEFDVTLLDRSAKRKSAWTPAALRLAEIYDQNSRKLQSSIREALDAQVPHHIHLGTLEGLSDEALKITHSLLESTKVRTIELDVYDQNELDEKFFNGDLDIIFTVREPGKQKFKHILEIGYQTMDKTDSNPSFSVMSPFEYGRMKKKPENKVLISNSLFVRQNWFERYGGHGHLPSKFKRGRAKNSIPVLIIASELFNEALWRIVLQTTEKNSP